MPPSYWSVISALCVVVSLLNGRELFAQIPVGSSDCPPPVFDTTSEGIGPRLPTYTDLIPIRSPDQKKLLFAAAQDGPLYVLDLASLRVRDVSVPMNAVPGNRSSYGIPASSTLWCPYDPDLIIFTVSSVVDTPGHPGRYLENVIEYRISTGEAKQIAMPGNPYGCTVVGVLPGGWMQGSHAGSDSLLVGYLVDHGSQNPEQIVGIYVPQTGALIPLPFEPPGPGYDTAKTVVSYSYDRHDSVAAKRDGGVYTRAGSLAHTHYFVDEQLVHFDGLVDTTAGVSHVTYSPDHRLVAFEVGGFGFGEPLQSQYGNYNEVWIFEISDPSRPLDVIDLARNFCMYSYLGVWPEFITDSTLAVSMQKDRDSVCSLWEISVGGTLLRRLTSVSLANVAVHRPAIPVTVTLSHKELEVTSSSLLKAVAILDLTGRTVTRRTASGASSLSLDLGAFTDGLYFISIETFAGSTLKKIVLLK